MTSRAVTLFLILSLAINLVFVSAAIGFWLRKPDGPRFPAHLGNVLENVDPEQRKIMQERFAEYREQGRPLHRKMRQSQRALAKAILAEPFDEAAVRQAFEQSRLARDNVQKHMHEQMLEVMGGLDRQQRAELMRRLLRGPMDGPPGPPPGKPPEPR